MVVYLCQFQSPNSSHLPLPRQVHMPALYVCVSIPALRINSSVPFFSRLHIHTCKLSFHAFIVILCIHLFFHLPTFIENLLSARNYVDSGTRKINKTQRLPSERSALSMDKTIQKANEILMGDKLPRDDR